MKITAYHHRLYRMDSSAAESFSSTIEGGASSDRHAVRNPTLSIQVEYFTCVLSTHSAYSVPPAILDMPAAEIDDDAEAM